MRTPSELDAIVGDDPDNPNEVLLGSPAVGHYSSAPVAGEVVVGGSRIGRLTALGRTVDLVVPRGVTGRVADRKAPSRSEPVEYGQILVRLMPVEASDGGEARAVHPDEAAEDLAEGTFAVRSFTHGMFYRRPRPDEPPYVEVGQIIEQGATLGLVEVMKCFSAVVYGGHNLPDRAEIVAVQAEEGDEVTTDQILFVVRPA